MSTSNPVIAVGIHVGDVVDRKYRIEQILGAGGMGVVCAARHLELDTHVAIKLMLPEVVGDTDLVERFLREARAMVRIDSPHCTRVFDAGKLANGAPYMVMELLVGEDLGALLDRTPEPLPVATVVDWVLQACVGIAEAHSLGIIHRDLKPRNLFLARQPDGRAVIKVLDFGLAKTTMALDGAERALTRTSAVMGSPAYMSPEQMRALREVDGGTDIWSLGVCLYELLTRVGPFDAPTIAELHALVLVGTPRSPDTLRPDVPALLATTILRCLEKDRSRRFRDVGELAQALHVFAGSGRSAAAPAPPLFDSASTRAAFDRAPTAVAARSGDGRSSDTKTEVIMGPRVERSRTAPILAAVVAMLVLGGIGVVMGGRALHRAKLAAHPTGSVKAEPLAPAESVAAAAMAPPSETSPLASASASASPAPSASASDARLPVVGVASGPSATARGGGGTGPGAHGGGPARPSTTKATAAPTAKPAPSAEPPTVPTSRPITTAF